MKHAVKPAVPLTEAQIAGHKRRISYELRRFSSSREKTPDPSLCLLLTSLIFALGLFKEKLTVRKIKDRAFDWKVTHNTFEFKIERHPDAMIMEQHWRYKLSNNSFVRIGQRVLK